MTFDQQAITFLISAVGKQVIIFKIKKDFSGFTRIVRKKIIILTTVNVEDIEKSRVSNKVEEERYPETFRRLLHHQSEAAESEGRFL